MTSARRRAVLEAARAQHRGRWRDWRARNREAQLTIYWTGGPIAIARAHVDAWDALGYGVPLSIILELTFGKHRAHASRRAARWLRVDNSAARQSEPCNPPPPTG